MRCRVRNWHGAGPCGWARFHRRGQRRHPGAGGFCPPLCKPTPGRRLSWPHAQRLCKRNDDALSGYLQGNSWARRVLIEIAWLWRKYQSDSELARWYELRAADQSPRIRRIMLVALARKLAIALWRYVETGLRTSAPPRSIPSSAQLRDGRLAQLGAVLTTVKTNAAYGGDGRQS
jgi:hypothetical protein